MERSSIRVTATGLRFTHGPWSRQRTSRTDCGTRSRSTPNGTRILGFDNAHAPKKPKKFRYAGQKLPYDHRHRHASDKGMPYSFKDAYQLLKDFFEEVDRVLKARQEK